MAEGRRLPPWLLGLLIALVLFAAFLAVTALLGIGDDPGVEETGPIPLTLFDRPR